MTGRPEDALRSRRGAAVLLATALLLAAAPRGLEATEPLEIDGRVVDRTGAPIDKARVELQPIASFYQRALEILDGKIKRTPQAVVRTSADGGYRLAAPRVGMWQIEVYAPGKVPVRCRLTPLLAGETLPDAVLEPDAGLDVRVVDATGKAVAGAQVWAGLIQEDRPRRTRLASTWPWSPIGSYGRSDDSGRLRLSRREGQSYRLYAFAHGFLPAELEPGSAERAALRLERGREVSLTLLAASGEPVAEGVLTVSRRNWIGTPIGPGGRASVFVAPDKPLTVTVRLASGQIEATDLEVPAANFQTDRPLTRSWRLPPPVALSGRVVDRRSREAVAGALVWSHSDTGRVATSDARGGYRTLRGSAERGGLNAAAFGYAVAYAEADTTSEVGSDGVGGQVIALRPTGGLRGRVVDAAGEPIEDALIKITGHAQQLTARTAAAGEFRLAGLTVGEPYELVARAAGYAPRERRFSAEPGKVLEIVLELGRSVVGRLVSAEFEPVPGARVYLVPLEQDPRLLAHSMRSVEPPRADSDFQGRFRLDGLPERLMSLAVRADGFADRVVRGLDLAGVGAGGETPLDLGDIELDRGATLEGRVVSTDGEAIEGAEVQVTEATMDQTVQNLQAVEDLRRTAVSDANGDFSVAALGKHASLMLTVQHEAHVPRFLFQVDPGAGLLEVELERAARVSGRVIDGSGSPVPHLALGLEILATARSRLASTYERQHSTTAHSETDGTFEFTSVPPGRLKLSLPGGQGWVAEETKALTLEPGESVSGLVVRVGRGASLSGRVTDAAGLPIAEAGVTVHSRTGGSNFGASFRRQRSGGGGGTRDDGSYSLEGIDPELTNAFAVVAHSDYARLEQELELRPGANFVDFVLEPGGVVAGVVVTESGQPVPEAQIELAEVQAARGRVGTGNATVVSRDDGSFEVAGLGGGSYQVKARKTGFAESTAETVELAPGRRAEVALTMTRGGTIRGLVLGLEPAELAGVELLAANDTGAMATGLVAEGGEYRIPNVGFSSGRVLATNMSSGQILQQDFTLDPRGGEIWLDLDFGTGFDLTGTVRRNGDPLPAAQLIAIRSGESAGSALTDATGRFRIAGVEAGEVRLRVAVGGVSSHEQIVQIAGDTEIEIDLAGVKVSGVVLGRPGLEPVPGASVRVFIADDPVSMFAAAGALTAAGGEFELELPAGRSVTLVARAPELAESSVEIEPLAADLSGIEIVLGPGDGLEIEIELWNGSRPGVASVALLDGAGNRLTSDILMSPRPGSFHLTSAPPGEWTLLVLADGAAVASLPVSVPGPAVRMTLTEGATLSVGLPEGNGARGSRLRLLTPGGTPLRFPGPGAIVSELPVAYLEQAGGTADIPSVPPGDWVVELIDSAGAVRRQGVTLSAGQSARVAFD